MYQITFLLILVLRVSVVAKASSFMCASYRRTKDSLYNNSGCDVNNKDKCKNVTCPAGIKFCIALVGNKTGQLKPMFLGCEINKGQPYGKCRTDVCLLEVHNGGFGCCCSGNMCNLNMLMSTVGPTIRTSTQLVEVKSKKSPNRRLLAYILAPAVVLLFLFILVVHFLRRRKDTMRQHENDHLLGPEDGQPLSRSIELLETVHEGQFADVLRAKYGEEIVALKSIKPGHSDLWTNERDIYQQCDLQHDNVLRFIGAEKREQGDEMQYWIITEYCSNGSLGDYLRKFTIGISDLIQMTLCILKGLDYLHSSHHTPSVTVAHRDLKSSNILVKSDMTCCIADFGLSLAFPFDENIEHTIDTSQVGTRRYMAPEVLRGAMTFNAECFKSVDMYSFALIAWELLSRTNTPDTSADPYELPYTVDVGHHPTLEAMIQCVAEHKKRPLLKDKWRTDDVLSVLCETIEECWDTDAYARISARLAYIRLSKLSVDIPSSSDENVSSSSSKDGVTFIDASEVADAHVVKMEESSI